MSSRVNFVKRSRSQKTKDLCRLKITKSCSKSLHQVHTQQQLSFIKKEDIKHFSVIGIFDKKVIVTYNNKLNIFGCFDLHAVHERIRYEYYCWKIKSQEFLSCHSSFIDHAVVEKGEKMPHSAFGALNKCLIKLQNSNNLLKYFRSNKKTSWGITLQKNSSSEVFVTSHRTIFSRQFSSEEISSIALELPNLAKGTIPRVINDWIGEFSCKSAFKFNDNLTLDQAKMLVRNLTNCDFPWHCVHGRTTIHIKPWPNLPH